MSIPSFAEALEYARKRKIVLPPEFYDPKNKDRRGQLMTISYLATLSQIEAVTDDLKKALAIGETMEQWKQRIQREGLPGLAPDHAETVFRNFMQTAYNGGRWEQFERNKKAVPYLMFSAINDDRTTDICRKRNGIIRPVDDPFWARNAPQMHHRCRSTLISLTKSQAESRSQGKNGLNKSAPDDKPADGWGNKPTLERQEESLAEVVADRLKEYTKKTQDKLTDIFSTGWQGLGGKLKKLLGG